MRRIELEIQDVAFGGKGVARDAGKAVFIPFTIEGERVTAKIVREKKQFAEAELVEVLEPFPQTAEIEAVVHLEIQRGKIGSSRGQPRELEMD